MTKPERSLSTFRNQKLKLLLHLFPVYLLLKTLAPFPSLKKIHFNKRKRSHWNIFVAALPQKIFIDEVIVLTTVYWSRSS